MQVFDATQNSLGEGVLWHPLRSSLFWFDILKHRLFERNLDDQNAKVWQFDAHVSAAGWIDFNTLMIASETELFAFNLEDETKNTLAPLEADNPITRSNDGRADRQGGFWIGTMGKRAEDKAGSIYRYYKGELRKLFGDLTITNSICFAIDGSIAYFTDTLTRQIMSVRLDQDGWPISEPKIYLDLNAAELSPDGAVIDAKGNMWIAQWGAGRVSCYDQTGKLVTAQHATAQQITCPAFGDDDYQTLFCTSASEGLGDVDIKTQNAGATYFIKLDDFKGVPEPQVFI